MPAASAKSSSATDAAAFAAALQAERDALAAFVDLLRGEEQFLVRGDAEGVAALASDKAARIEQLSLLGAQRNERLAMNSLAASADGMLTWLRRNPELTATVGELWQDLLAQAETARQINQNNGLMIDSRLQQTRLKLAVLQSGAASEGVYRPDGHLRPLSGARSLIQA